MKVAELLVDVAVCAALGVPIVLWMLADAKDIGADSALVRTAERLGLRVAGAPRLRELSGARDGAVFELKQLRTAWSTRDTGRPAFSSYRARVRLHESAEWLEWHRPVCLTADNLELEIAAVLQRAQRRAR